MSTLAYYQWVTGVHQEQPSGLAAQVLEWALQVVL